MLQRVAGLVVLVGLVGASEAVCQSQRPLDSVIRATQSGIPNTVRAHTDPRPSLPDAPSVAATNGLDTSARSTFEQEGTLKTAGRNAGIAREGRLDPVAAAVPPTFEQSLAMVYETSPAQKESSDFSASF